MSNATTKTASANTNTATEAATYAPESNVLPKTATRDEVDLHWFFNFAEADLAQPQMHSPYEQALLGRRVQSSPGSAAPVEPTAMQLDAAGRSSRVRKILDRLPPQAVSALARWAAPPARAPEPVRAIFGRLAFVTGITEAYEEIGGSRAFVEACTRAVQKRDKEDGTVNFLRHAARVKLEVLREEAQTLLTSAFEAFATARAVVDAEESTRKAKRDAARAPHLAALTEQANANDSGSTSGAMARLAGRLGR
jgi:hypothetical protein